MYSWCCNLYSVECWALSKLVEHWYISLVFFWEDDQSSEPDVYVKNIGSKQVNIAPLFYTCTMLRAIGSLSALFGSAPVSVHTISSHNMIGWRFSGCLVHATREQRTWARTKKRISFPFPASQSPQRLLHASGQAQLVMQVTNRPNAAYHGPGHAGVRDERSICS
jgi:hypothetical protein